MTNILDQMTFYGLIGNKTMIESVGYVIQDKQGNAIHGFGDTASDAWEMVCEIGSFVDAYGDEMDESTAYETQFKTYGATAALINQVKEEGGAISWCIVRGVACTKEEAEQF